MVTRQHRPPNKLLEFLADYRGDWRGRGFVGRGVGTGRGPMGGADGTGRGDRTDGVVGTGRGPVGGADGTGRGDRTGRGPVGHGAGVGFLDLVAVGGGGFAASRWAADEWEPAGPDGPPATSAKPMPPPAITTAAGSPTINARVRITFMCRLLSKPGGVRRPADVPAARSSGCTAADFHHSASSLGAVRIPLARPVTIGTTARRGRQKVSPEEFTDFYAAAFRRLVGQLYAMTGDLAESEEAVQEAFVRAWSHRGTLDAQSSPEAWVRTTAWHIAVSRWRRARLGRLLMRAQPPPQVTDGPGPDRVALVDALRKVPADQRPAPVLDHLCGLTVAHVAAETGL